ncbi:hypothetical protein V5T82_05875 [Magnetovibrio sp. PR-2]|uniref:hypothetical protein n=1 Tax=Magnetovibrio sp. PR-2 TaxID=3120356 RepID=UPI002FCE29BA
MLSQYPTPAPQTDAIQATFHNEDARDFVISTDTGNLCFKITRKALREFEKEGLHAMDECLIELSERLTPANEPERRPDPLTLLSQIMMDSFNTADSQTMMICVLWLGHHYPAVCGLKKYNDMYEFSWDNPKV